MSLRNFIFVLVFIVVADTKCNGQISTGTKSDTAKIQMALLLDISGSMDQLLLKAKSQLWRIATYLNKGTKNGNKVTVELAIITYGGNFGVEDHYTTILSDLTCDLDSISDKLYQIQIGGSEEHCWSAIDIALDNLNWSRFKKDLRIILIAGNESFEQGDSDSDVVVRKAKKLDVIINTIYCNAREDTFSAQWQAAAALGKGSYFVLTLEDSLNITENFMDIKLIDFNHKLNATYIPFGDHGKSGIERMIRQDRNSKLAGMPLFRERVAYKAQESFVNPTWDLVDAMKLDSTILARTTKDNMPEEFKSLDEEQILKVLEDKWHTRESYKEAIRLRYEMITRYLGESAAKNSLDLTVKEIVDREGKKKGFVFQ